MGGGPGTVGCGRLAEEFGFGPLRQSQVTENDEEGISCLPKKYLRQVGLLSFL